MDAVTSYYIFLIKRDGALQVEDITEFPEINFVNDNVMACDCDTCIMRERRTMAMHKDINHQSFWRDHHYKIGEVSEH